jgi:CelD/BcsL family acetyltransferase involved in cellulose biosynthesis
MVDANGALDGLLRNGRTLSRSVAEAGDVTVHAGTDALAACMEAWRPARFAPPQDPLWIESWAASGNLDLVTAILSDARGPLMALALQVDRAGPFRIGRFVGGSHANGNFPALFGAAPDAAALRRMVEALRRERPDIDMLALERQLPELDGVPNAFLQLPHAPSPNIALAADLAGGFDAVLERVNGKRKRKKYRSQLRKFESAGGFRRFRAGTPAEIDALLAAFFDMKRQRFAAQGIADVFADGSVRAAFRRLYVDALASSPPRFFLEALEVGGRIRAVTGSSLSGKRIICDFCAFSHDELTAASPGDFLFFESIREACEQDFAVYDFSVGEERYKRAWCDIETSQFDVFLPLTLKGHLLAAGQAGLSQAKRAVKRNETLWRIAKRLRPTRSTSEPEDMGN